MRFSPTKLLQGLLCTTPILLLTLAACGGGGGGGSTATLASAYTLGGAVIGLTGTGLVLRNNGGDDTTILSTDLTYTFSNSVLSGNSYNITVLTNPTSPNQSCTVAPASGTMPASNISNADVTCVNAFTISGNISGVAPNTGLVLQNNGGDNLQVPAGQTTFIFSTPIVNNGSAVVSVLTNPQGQTCSVTTNAANPVTADDASAVVNCANNVTPPAPDPYVYAANFGSATSNVSVYTSSSGALTPGAAVSAQNAPSAIAVDAGKFAYVTNYSSNNISAYSITAGVLASIDADGAISGTQNYIATGSHPLGIAIHPSGKFAYVTNYSSYSVTAYSIDPVTGALASIDADDATPGNQTSISTGSGPVSIAIHPGGGYAYVANSAGNSVSTYSINATSGALTAIPADGVSGPTYISTGGDVAPYSIAVDPSGQYLYAVNATSNSVSHFDIASDGSLTRINCAAGTGCNSNGNFDTGVNPRSVAVDPTGQFLYVANTTDGKIWVYSIGLAGVLTHSASTTTEVSTGGSPLSISIDSTGQYLYVANDNASGTVAAFGINTTTGELTAVGSPVAAGTQTFSVTTSR